MRGKFDAFGRNFFALKKSKMQDQGLFAYMQEDICRIVKSEKVADFRFHIMVWFFLWIWLTHLTQIVGIETVITKCQ